MNLKGLRPPLVLNAAFSGAIGLIVATASATVARWLGPPTTWVYAFLGIGLLLFSLTLGVVAMRPSPLAVAVITFADLGWVICTTAVLLAWGRSFTPLGSGFIMGANVVVSTVAWLQQRSIRKAFQAPGGRPGEYQICVAAEAPVAADAFWTVLADLGKIQRYMPALKFSGLTVGEKPGVGCVRTCQSVKGQVWSERCEEWDEGKSFTVAFLADAPGFPFPFSKMRGGWRVSPNAAGCRVEVWWGVVPRRPWATAVILPLFAASAQRTFAEVVGRMTDAAQGRAIGDSAVRAALPRLRAALC